MGTHPFRAARDLLLRNRNDLDAARDAFRWPALDRFNWALDHFDELPGDRVALWIVGEGGREERVTFARMRARSNQVANCCARKACDAETECCSCSATSGRSGRRRSPASSSARS